MMMGRLSHKVHLPIGPQWGDPQNGKGGVAACMNWTYGRRSERPKTAGARLTSRAPSGLKCQEEGDPLVVQGRASHLELKNAKNDVNSREAEQRPRPATAGPGRTGVDRPSTGLRPPPGGVPPQPPGGGRKAWADTQPPGGSRKAWGDTQPWTDKPRYTPTPPRTGSLLKNGATNERAWPTSGRNAPLPPKSMNSEAREVVHATDDVVEEWKYTKYKEQSIYDLFDTDAFSPEPGMGSKRPATVAGYKPNRSYRSDTWRTNCTARNATHTGHRQAGPPETNDLSVLEKHNSLNRNNAHPSRDGPINPRDEPVHKRLNPSLPGNRMREPFRPKGLQPRINKNRYPPKVQYDRMARQAQKMGLQSRKDCSSHEFLQPTVTTFRDTTAGSGGALTLRVDCREQPVSGLTIRVIDGINGPTGVPSFQVASFSPVVRPGVIVH